MQPGLWAQRELVAWLEGAPGGEQARPAVRSMALNEDRTQEHCRECLRPHHGKPQRSRSWVVGQSSVPFGGAAGGPFLGKQRWEGIVEKCHHRVPGRQDEGALSVKT